MLGRRVLVAAVVTVSALACESNVAGPDLGPEGPFGIETSAERYQMLPWQSRWGGYQVAIRYTFTNRTGGPVSLVGCRDDYNLKLERWSGREWESAWYNLPFTCLSYRVIEANETFSQEWLFFGAPPEFSDEIIPTFDAEAGTYRIRWTQAYTLFDEDTFEYGDLIPLADRLSNTFRLAF